MKFKNKTTLLGVGSKKTECVTRITFSDFFSSNTGI